MSNNKPLSSCLADLESLKSFFTATHHRDKLVLLVQEARRTCLGIIRVDGGAAYPCPTVLCTDQPHNRKEPWMGIQWKLILLVTCGHWLEMKPGRSGNSRSFLCLSYYLGGGPFHSVSKKEIEGSLVRGSVWGRPRGGGRSCAGQGLPVRMKWEEDEGHREAERGRDSMAVNSGGYSDFRDPKDQVPPENPSVTKELQSHT